MGFWGVSSMDQPDQTTHFGFRDVSLDDKQTLVNDVTSTASSASGAGANASAPVTVGTSGELLEGGAPEPPRSHKRAPR